MGRGLSMRRHRPTKLFRLLLTTLVLVGSVGSTPTFSHTHARPDSSHDTHHEWLGHDHTSSASLTDHDHTSSVSPSDHDHEYAVSADDSAYHLHGVWLGIPFSLPNPSGQEGSRLGVLPSSEACLTPSASADADPLGARSSPWPTVWGLASSLRTWCGSSPLALLANASAHGAASPCALLARSVMLRC